MEFDRTPSAIREELCTMAFEQEVGALLHACRVRYRTQEQVRPAAAGAATNLTLHGLGFCVCHSHGR